MLVKPLLQRLAEKEEITFEVSDALSAISKFKAQNTSEIKTNAPFSPSNISFNIGLEDTNNAVSHLSTLFKGVTISLSLNLAVNIISNILMN